MALSELSSKSFFLRISSVHESQTDKRIGLFPLPEKRRENSNPSFIAPFSLFSFLFFLVMVSCLWCSQSSLFYFTTHPSVLSVNLLHPTAPFFLGSVSRACSSISFTPEDPFLFSPLFFSFFWLDLRTASDEPSFDHKRDLPFILTATSALHHHVHRSLPP